MTTDCKIMGKDVKYDHEDEDDNVADGEGDNIDERLGKERRNKTTDDEPKFNDVERTRVG